MSICAGYTKNCSISTKDSIYYLKKYGHLLKWKSYKEDILDIGCADGSVTRNILFPFIKNHVGTLEAIDKLQPMIELARNTNDTEEIEFNAIDINNKQYTASKKFKFDHIFSFYCIHWIVDTSSLLSQFYDMLKPGGQIFIVAASDAPALQAFRMLSKERIWSKYFQITDPCANYGENPEKYIQDLLESIGFEVDLCKFEKRDGIVENYIDFSRSVVHMSDHFVQVPAELREKYIKDHVEIVCKNSVYLGHPDKYKMLYESIIFIASKKM